VEAVRQELADVYRRMETIQIRARHAGEQEAAGQCGDGSLRRELPQQGQRR